MNRNHRILYAVAGVLLVYFISVTISQPRNGESLTPAADIDPTSRLESPTLPMTPTPRDEHILWSADHETGDLSQWTKNDGGGVFNSGTGEITVTDTVAHSGRYALALTVTDANETTQGARIFRWAESPKEGYYSAWYYFPRRYQPIEWWNVFQFKSKDDAGNTLSGWSLNIGNLPNGDMSLYVWDSISKRSYGFQDVLQPLPIPVRKWVHVEVFFRRATDQTGQVTVWQDGLKLYDITGVRTAYSDTVRWSLNNYTDAIIPSTATIYIDDAVISATRIGSSEATIYLPAIFQVAQP